MFKWCNLRGFTLIEILIALTLGGVIILGFLEIIAKIRHALFVQQDKIALLDEMRFINQYVTQQVQYANSYQDPAGHLCAHRNGTIACYFLWNARLYEKVIGHRGIELARHVVRMQVYFNQGQVLIWFLMHSAHRILHQASDYYFADRHYLSSDGYFHLSWPLSIVR